MKRTNLRDDQFKREQMNRSKLNRAATLQSASVDKGRTRFQDSVLRGEGASTFDWSGEAITNGPFTNSGPFRNIGPTDLDGPTTVTGTTDLNGTTTVNGDLAVTKTLDVTAETTLRAITHVLDDLILEAGGELKAGVITITGFDGGQIRAMGADLVLAASFGSFVKLSAAVAESLLVNNNLNVLGKMTVVDDTELIGNLDVPNLPTTTDPPNLRVIDGRLHRCI